MDTLTAIPAPVLAEHDGFVVLRDDMIEGGTKVRAAPYCLDGHDEWVFAGPGQGYAQLALAIGCEMTGKQATFFTAQRKQPTYVTRGALAHGLNLIEVPAGRLTVVRARARTYIEEAQARGVNIAPLIGMGLALPGMSERMTDIARALPTQPAEVWVACGSGLLASSLQAAWPHASVNAVVVGMNPDKLDPRVARWPAPEPFDKDATGPLPPFPSVRNYDAKVWRFVLGHASPGALVWNVGR